MKVRTRPNGKAAAVNGTEIDATSRRSKKMLGWRAGERAAIKTAMHRRDRRASNQITRYLAD